MHPCRKCFLSNESKNNNVCRECDARVLACQDIYIEPPPKQPVTFHEWTPREITRADIRFQKVMKELGFKDEEVMWHTLYWVRRMPLLKIKILMRSILKDNIAEMAIKARMDKFKVPRRAAGGKRKNAFESCGVF